MRRVRGSDRVRVAAQPVTRDLLRPGAVEISFQPVVEVATGALVAAEALAYFPSLGSVDVADVFRAAHLEGWGSDLEAVCLRTALGKRVELPAGVRLAVNLSPNALRHPMVEWTLAGDLRGVMIEITELEAEDPDHLTAALAGIRRRGGWVAIDDATTGYSGLLRLSELRPHIVKLDRGLVTGCYDSDVRRAVIEALVSLSRHIGAVTLGEGVESAADLAALAELNVDYAQGWAIGRPGPVLMSSLPEAADLARSARATLLRTALAPEQAVAVTDLTAAIAATVGLAELHEVITAAAADLGVDALSLSTLARDGALREVSSSGEGVDESAYALSDFPATRDALVTGSITEVHLSDPAGDPAELALLARDGFASLLITPVVWGGEPLGVLEFRHRTHRRWTRIDLAQARTVAAHVASVLHRVDGR